jgi:hypothetical protein
MQIVDNWWKQKADAGAVEAEVAPHQGKRQHE